MANPKVRDEIAKVMGFWLELGISGFRVDAVPFLLGLEGIPDSQKERFADPHDYLAALRSFLGRRTGDGILLGEVNLPYPEQKKFFGGRDGDELTMMFDFVGMQNLYLSLARHDARPLARTLKRRPAINPDAQWTSFLRNHDELTVDKLSESERQEVFAAFDAAPELQLFGRGLRRRLPPMLDGDPRRIKMAYSLMFSLPGTPSLFYGEEIGMGENLDIEGRIAVRSPMQWSPQRNGGFTTAAPSRLRRPVVEGPFSPAHINVTDQRADPDSLLSFVALLIRRYRESPEFGWSDFTILDQPHRSVLAHDCRWDDRRMLAVHNLSPERCTVPLKLTDCVPGSRLADLLQEGETELDPDGRVEVAMDGYGYRWLRVMPPGGAGWPEGPRSLDAAARPPPWRSDARSHYETAWSADPPVAPTREVGQASRRAAPRESAAAGLGEVEVGRQDCSRPAVKSGRMHPWSWMDVADGRLLASVGHATGVGHDASAAIDVSSCVQRGTLEVIASRVRPTAPHP